MDILIPLDGKPHSQRSVDLALELFELSGKSVLLFHVVEAAEPQVLLEDVTGKLEETYAITSKEAAQELLSKVSEPLLAAGANVIIQIAEGLPAAEIKSVVLKEQVPVIVAAPGKHSAQEMLLKGSITASLLNFQYEGTVMLARKEPPKESPGPIAFLLNGSQESSMAVKALVPLLSKSLPLLLVASEKVCGAPEPHEILLSRNAKQSEQHEHPANKTSDALRSITTWLSSMNRAHRTELAGTTFSDWLSVQEEQISLLVLARSRKDVVHRPIAGSEAERIFLTASCPTALYCSKIMS